MLNDGWREMIQMMSGGYATSAADPWADERPWESPESTELAMQSQTNCLTLAVAGCCSPEEQGYLTRCVVQADPSSKTFHAQST